MTLSIIFAFKAFVIILSIVSFSGNFLKKSRRNEDEFDVVLNTRCSLVLTNLAVDLLKINPEEFPKRIENYLKQIQPFIKGTSINPRKYYQQYKLKKIPPKTLVSEINALKNQYRIKILYALFKIAIIEDGYTIEEMQYLRNAATKLKINNSNYEYICSLFVQQQERKEANTIFESKVQRKLALAFSILGASENDSTDTLKSIFRRLAIEHHPDKVTHLGEEKRLIAEMKFKEITEAYEYIKMYRQL